MFYVALTRLSRMVSKVIFNELLLPADEHGDVFSY